MKPFDSPSRWSFAAALLAVPFVSAVLAQPAHSSRQTAQLVFHYGVVPSELVLAHPEQHPERAMHDAGARKRTSHVVVALFDVGTGQRISTAEVQATVSLFGGASQTKRLEPMQIAGQPSFGGFFRMGAPGIYRIRSEARQAGRSDAASAEFEHRVPGPERGR